ncbi:MAG: hypothetical protein R6U65_08255 [Perlabentimonas sp.]
MTEVTLKLDKVVLHRKTAGPMERRVPHNMSNMRMHWAQKNRWKKLWQYEVEEKVMINRKQFGRLPLRKPTIIFTLQMCQPYDRDGAYHAVKPLLDALQVYKGIDKAGFPIPGAGVITEDSQDAIDLYVYTKKVPKRHLEGVIIDIKQK